MTENKTKDNNEEPKSEYYESKEKLVIILKVTYQKFLYSASTLLMKLNSLVVIVFRYSNKLILTISLYLIFSNSVFAVLRKVTRQFALQLIILFIFIVIVCCAITFLSQKIFFHLEYQDSEGSSNSLFKKLILKWGEVPGKRLLIISLLIFFLSVQQEKIPNHTKSITRKEVRCTHEMEKHFQFLKKTDFDKVWLEVSKMDTFHVYSDDETLNMLIPIASKFENTTIQTYRYTNSEIDGLSEKLEADGKHYLVIIKSEIKNDSEYKFETNVIVNNLFDTSPNKVEPMHEQEVLRVGTHCVNTIYHALFRFYSEDYKSATLLFSDAIALFKSRGYNSKMNTSIAYYCKSACDYFLEMPFEALRDIKIAISILDSEQYIKDFKTNKTKQNLYECYLLYMASVFSYEHFIDKYFDKNFGAISTNRIIRKELEYICLDIESEYEKLASLTSEFDPRYKLLYACADSCLRWTHENTLVNYTFIYDFDNRFFSK